MNVFNQLEIEGEPLLESCDECNALIVNWETLTNSFLTFDNRVVCKKCLKEELGEENYNLLNSICLHCFVNSYITMDAATCTFKLLNTPY